MNCFSSPLEDPLLVEKTCKHMTTSIVVSCKCVEGGCGEWEGNSFQICMHKLDSGFLAGQDKTNASIQSPDPSPPTSISHPPDVINVIGVPRSSPHALQCIIWNTNQRKKNGSRGLGMRLPGNIRDDKRTWT